MMSRKHYRAIAEVIDEMEVRVSTIKLVERLADVFADDNPNFNRKKFREACYKRDEIRRNYEEAETQKRLLKAVGIVSDK